MSLPPSLCNSLLHFSLEEDQPKEMAVKIRLARLGCINRAFYRIVATDSHIPRNGKHLRVVGFYDPLADSLFFFLPFSYYFHMLSSHGDFFFNFKGLNFEGL
ncbi:30S ribosomal protein [Populus alba x Populus x berolinensis]|nr:30S ribosomal protein [Populus alba x Populus x berolinensis]